MSTNSIQNSTCANFFQRFGKSFKKFLKVSKTLKGDSTSEILQSAIGFLILIKLCEILV